MADTTNLCAWCGPVDPALSSRLCPRHREENWAKLIGRYSGERRARIRAAIEGARLALAAEAQTEDQPEEAIQP